LWYRPERSRFSLHRNRLRRLHRKLALVDERIAFVGGVNILDDTPGGRINAPRLDYMVEMQGSTTEYVNFVMKRLWALVSWRNFKRQREHIKLLLTHKSATQHGVTLVLRDNFRHRHDIERAYLKAIAGARREIIIANAYFLPGKTFGVL